MFVLIAYDVPADRCNKYHSLLSKYLLHKQNSLFEGTISEKKYKELLEKINSILIIDDRICIYKLDSLKYVSIEKLGNKHESFIV